MPDKKPKSLRALENTELAKDIVNKFTSTVAFRTPYKNKWDRFYKMYRGVLDETNYPWQSNIWVPLSFSTIETVVPRLVSNRPQIDILPREPNDEKYAQIMGKIIDYQWDQMNMNVLLPEAVKEMCIYGTVVLKAFWYKEESNVIDKQMVDEQMPELGQVEVEENKTIYNGPKVEVVDLYDFFVDPKATTIDNAEWVIHRSMRTLDYLHEMMEDGKYKNIKLLEDEGGSFAGNDDEKQMRRNTIGISMPVEQRNDKLIEILEYWTDERVITVANRKIIIRDQENPFRHGKKPFIVCVDQKIPHEFYGMGELEPIETLQYELNDRRNQRMDNVTLILNRMWVVQNGKGVDEDELVSDAGGVVHTDDPNAIQQLVLPDVTSSSYQEETIIKADIQQTSGVTDFTRGMSSDALANDTATGISLLQEASNARFRLKIQNIEDMMLKRLGEMMVSMNNQFMSDETTIRIVGDEGKEFETIKPEDIKGNFDVSVQAGSTIPGNESIMKKQVMEMYKLFAGDPEVDQRELKKMVLKVVNPNVNFEKLFVKKEALNPPQPNEMDMMQASQPTPTPTGELMSAKAPVQA